MEIVVVALLYRLVNPQPASELPIGIVLEQRSRRGSDGFLGVILGTSQPQYLVPEEDVEVVPGLMLEGRNVLYLPPADQAPVSTDAAQFFVSLEDGPLVKRGKVYGGRPGFGGTLLHVDIDFDTVVASDTVMECDEDGWVEWSGEPKVGPDAFLKDPSLRGQFRLRGGRELVSGVAHGLRWDRDARYPASDIVAFKITPDSKPARTVPRHDDHADTSIEAQVRAEADVEIASKIAEALAAGPDADGWIEWKGGECPVPANTQVQIQLRMYATRPERSDSWDSTHEAQTLRWSHGMGRENFGDIIAYRVVEQKSQDTSQGPDEEPWIDWTSGEMPVDGDTMVEVGFRDEWCGHKTFVAPAGCFGWSGTGGASDIVCYRPTSKDAMPPPEQAVEFDLSEIFSDFSEKMKRSKQMKDETKELINREQQALITAREILPTIVSSAEHLGMPDRRETAVQLAYAIADTFMAESERRVKAIADGLLAKFGEKAASEIKPEPPEDWFGKKGA